LNERIECIRYSSPLYGHHPIEGPHYMQLWTNLAQIFLVADEDDWHVRAEVTHLWRPFLRDVLEAVGTVDRKTHQDHIGVWIGQRTESVVVLLPRCIPEC